MAKGHKIAKGPLEAGQGQMFRMAAECSCGRWKRTEYSKDPKKVRRRLNSKIRSHKIFG
jgi:hypothetical protein